MKLYGRRLLLTLNCEQLNSTLINIDNLAAISLADGKGKFEKSKHIDIKYFILQEAVEWKIITTKWIPSEDNLADIFTTPLSEIQFKKLSSKVMGSI